MRSRRRPDMTAPLHGVRVLAVEQYGAGPFGTQHLADLGAEVVKIENPHTGGDYARRLGPYFAKNAEGDDESLFFQAVNRNKRSVTLDLSQEEGQRAFRRLAARADAVANNLRGDVPERLGLAYDRLKDVNAAIVCAHCSAYGREGPRRSWPGFDYLMQAEAGYFHLSGEPGSPPTRVGLSIVDFMAGTCLALGLVAGVLSARASGIGRDIDVSLHDTALFNLSYMATWALNTDYAPARQPRSAHPHIVPCQLYRTADGWIFVMCNKESFWPALCARIGRPELAADPRYRSFAERAERRAELTDLLDAALSHRSTEEWMQILGGHVPVAPIRTPREALTDPALAEAGRIDSYALGPQNGFRTLRSPIRAGSAESSTACPPPGADTRELLQEAGYSPSELRRLGEQTCI